ncbi:NAC domain-containing protein 83 [Oryza brachyantha]|uniref:NAC domain-containing protein 83 n=1 Tax=Oryza brachyantha TaxID=4533 RepID=UPI001ADCB57B|nr:NAC domain-containing protein 83 [Oryza brachyantha]
MEAKECAARRALPPGFRFRPTDEELVVHYLRRRALDTPLPPAIDIPDVRLLAHDPSDLLPPGWSEQERYFFTCKEAKYVKGRRANRATGAGYWKATGKEKPVAVPVPGPGPRGQSVVVGMKRSLVFYRGKPPSGKKTDWVMHEYRLAGAGLAPCRRAAKDAAAAAAGDHPPRPADGWVLCRVFRKKGSPASTTTPAAAMERDDEAVLDDDDGGDGGAVTAGVRFIDFFARADARGRRPASPVSSSCVTDASAEHCREQETTSRGASD